MYTANCVTFPTHPKSDVAPLTLVPWVESDLVWCDRFISVCGGNSVVNEIPYVSIGFERVASKVAC